MRNNNTAAFTIPLLPIALILIALKLSNTVDWSWWWVLAPIWIPLGFVTLFFLSFMAVVFTAAIGLIISGRDVDYTLQRRCRKKRRF